LAVERKVHKHSANEKEIHLQTVRLFLPTLWVAVYVVSAFAEDRPSKEIAIEAPGEFRSTALYKANAESLILPEAPRKKIKVKAIDKKFIVLMTALGGAESLQFTTHKLVLDHEFAAGAPWVASVPANQHQVAKYAAIYAAEVIAAYELKKPHSWLPGDVLFKSCGGCIRRRWCLFILGMVFAAFARKPRPERPIVPRSINNIVATHLDRGDVGGSLNHLCVSRITRGASSG
jgi:hypothetical protein